MNMAGGGFVVFRVFMRIQAMKTHSGSADILGLNSYSCYHAFWCGSDEKTAGKKRGTQTRQANRRTMNYSMKTKGMQGKDGGELLWTKPPKPYIRIASRQKGLLSSLSCYGKT
jgi:hypothetical protein